MTAATTITTATTTTVMYTFRSVSSAFYNYSDVPDHQRKTSININNSYYLMGSAVNTFSSHNSPVRYILLFLFYKQ